MSGLSDIAQALRAHPSIRSKLAIRSATAQLGLTAASTGKPGDDAAILPRLDGFDLIAGEGFIPAFIADDPWFAGWCAVMVNLSDIAAMGGTARAIVDQIWAPDAQAAVPMLDGMKAASEAYGVPLVGGHTNFAAPDLGLAATVLGHTRRPITSFEARKGDVLITAIDPRGSYRNFDNFFAAGNAPAERLRADLALLPEIAEAGLVTAGKDISQGGIIGTALMLAECSDVAITLDVDALAVPQGIPPERWLRSFPSFGFLLSTERDNADELCARFRARDITASVIGEVSGGHTVALRSGAETTLFWDYADTPYLDLGA